MLDEVRRTQSGRLLAMRGRRRVGKSRLVQEWVEREGVPYVFFEAERSGQREELRSFADAVSRSALAAASLVGAGVAFQSWDAALRLIARASGALGTTLNRALDVLTRQKRVVAAELALSTLAARHKRYRVADSYLRFWLRFIGPAIPEIERGRTDLVVDRIRSNWPGYLGHAIEPVVREAITRLLPDTRFGEARYRGAYWTRNGQVEVELVGADSEPVATRVVFVGSIKWRERQPFDRHRQAELSAQRTLVPGTTPDTLLVAVTRSGCTAAGLDVVLGPEDLPGAWAGRPPHH